MFPFCRTASDQSSATWRVGPAQAVLDSCGYVEQFIYLSVHLFMYVFIYLLNLLIYLRIFSVFVYTFLYGHVCVYIHRERERYVCVCLCGWVAGWSKLSSLDQSYDSSYHIFIVRSCEVATFQLTMRRLRRCPIEFQYTSGLAENTPR